VPGPFDDVGRASRQVVKEAGKDIERAIEQKIEKEALPKAESAIVKAVEHAVAKEADRVAKPAERVAAQEAEQAARPAAAPATEQKIEPPAAPKLGELTSKAVPQGLTTETFAQLSRTVRQGAGHIGEDIAVHGSRASGTVKATSDIDIAIRVSSERFEELIRASFGRPNPGSAKERTMLHAVSTGKINARWAGLSALRESIEKTLDMDVDISVIRIGGAFDQGPYIPLR
jgi:hypothetical protein